MLTSKELKHYRMPESNVLCSLNERFLDCIDISELGRDASIKVGPPLHSASGSAHMQWHIIWHFALFPPFEQELIEGKYTSAELPVSDIFVFLFLQILRYNLELCSLLPEGMQQAVLASSL